jgi:hypothetical protein
MWAKTCIQGSNPCRSAKDQSTQVQRSLPKQQKALIYQGFLSSEVQDRPLRSSTLRGYLVGYRGKPYGGIFLPGLKDLDISEIITQRRIRQLKGQLTDLSLRNLSTRECPYKVSDGNGLYVLVSPIGLRAWRWKYRFASCEKAGMASVFKDRLCIRPFSPRLPVTTDAAFARFACLGTRTAVP